MTRCSVIIPVHGKAEMTRECLDAVLADRPAVLDEIVVVDDASTDATPEVLATFGDAVRVVRLEENTGFAGACNAGAAVAGAPHLVFLNNDTIPQPGWLDALVDDATANEAAVVGARLLFPDGTVQHAGVVICTDGNPRHVYAGLPADHPAVLRPRRLQAVTAACMLVARDAFDAVGGFDTQYRNGLEDTDLCLRIGERGGVVRYCPTSVLVHLESVSRGRQSREIERNGKLFRERWTGRVHSDELEHYLEDGLLRIDYDDVHPLRVEIAPELAVVREDAGELRRLVDARAGHVVDLLKETVRLTAFIAERGPVADGQGPAFAPPPALESARRIESAIHELQVAVARSVDGFTPSAYLGYRGLVDAIRDTIRRAVPRGASFLVISRGDDELLDVDGRTGGHFPQTADGRYLGHHPADGAAALAHLEELRARGAEYLVVPSTAAWWLDHYATFAAHLDETSAEVGDEAGACRIFQLGASPRPRAASSPTPPYDDLVDAVPRTVTACVPPEATVLVVSRGDDGLLRLPGRRAQHFPQDAAGAYAGHHPASSADAIEHLEELRARGAGFLVLPATAFWWLEHYAELAAHLETTCDVVTRDATCVVYRLPAVAHRADAAPPSLPAASSARISVVITSHDKARYLDETLDSVEAQTLAPAEVVIVDDASRDDTADVAQRRGVPCHRVELRSPALSRNHGAGLVRGDLLCFLDGDDLLEPDFLERHAEALEHRPDAGFAFGRIREFGERRRLWPKQQWDHDLLRRWNYVPGASVVRASAFHAVGGYPDLGGAEDWGLWLQVSRAGWPGVACETTWRWRRTAGSRNAARTWGGDPVFADEAPLGCMDVAIVTVLDGGAAPGPAWWETLQDLAWDRGSVHVWVVDASGETRAVPPLAADAAGLEGFAGVHVVRAGDRAAAYTWVARRVDADLIAFLGPDAQPPAGGGLIGDLVAALDWTAPGVDPSGDLTCALVRREALRGRVFDALSPERAFARALRDEGRPLLTRASAPAAPVGSDVA